MSHRNSDSTSWDFSHSPPMSGTRSARGTQTKMTLASLFGTWWVQGINPYQACLDLLASPQV